MSVFLFQAYFSKGGPYIVYSIVSQADRLCQKSLSHRLHLFMMMKRKLDVVDSKASKSKVPLKAELIIQLKELQDSFDALKATNIKNLDTINILQNRIEALERDKYESQKEAKTEDKLTLHNDNNHDMCPDDLDSSEGVRYCKRCDYEAEDRYDLDGHIWTEHEEDEDGHINCKFCDEKFANVANLMMHKKIKHREKINSCQNFNAGGCPFQDKKCWFLHIKSNESFECSICDQTFSSKSHFMLHRKYQHTEMVQNCKNIECVFEESCWFRHEHEDTQLNKEKTNENEKYMQKLLEIVEKLSEKVSNLEKVNEVRQNTI